MLRKIHIEKLSTAIGDILPTIGRPNVGMEQITKRISNIFTQNVDTERLIDEEAHKLLDKHRKAAGGAEIDEQKAFAMIKKQLAKQKGFTL